MGIIPQAGSTFRVLGSRSRSVYLRGPSDNPQEHTPGFMPVGGVCCQNLRHLCNMLRAFPLSLKVVDTMGYTSAYYVTLIQV